MQKNRLEAFSDGVLAIVITIMVLELKVPHGAGWDALTPLIPVFASYVLSYVYIGIYWSNHHHLLHAASHVSGPILWANLNLLFWLSLFPFATAWVGHNHAAPEPAAAYGGLLLMAAVSYYLLQSSIVAKHGPDAVLARALGPDWKGKLSPGIYLRDSAGVRQSMDFARAVRTRRVDLDRARPADRTGTGRMSAYGRVASSSCVSFSNACSFEWPHMSRLAARLAQTAGLSGLPNSRHRFSGLS